ncbi:MAG: Tm-1-like ATP-binding domain-containing protein, partial [Syntrophobacteraceae bacterium]|nr:Tm-1-like ATP-binding domain-containing protein [Syntrophobacteraceae bacterium]
ALSGFSTRYNDKGDIVLFHSVVEISGLSAILRNVIDRAACSIMGRLLEKYKPEIAHIGFKRGRGLAGPGLE